MPFPFSKRKRNATTSPEISVQSKSLIYSQPSYTASEQDSPKSDKPTISDRPVHKAISSDVFADITYHKEQKAKAAVAAKAKAENDPQAAEASTEPEVEFER